MRKFLMTLVNKFNDSSQLLKTISLSLGLIITVIFREPIAALIFNGKNFSGRNFVFQVLEIVFFSALIALILLILFYILKQIKVVSRALENLDSKYSDFIDTVKSDAHTRIMIALIVVGLGFAAIILFNIVLANIDTQTWGFSTTNLLPLMHPVGADFRDGIYNPAEALFAGKSITQIWTNTTNTSGYPPLVTFIGLFFLPLNVNIAYLVQVFLLTLSNIACLGLVVAITDKFLFSTLEIDKKSRPYISLFVFSTTLILIFSSYAFTFSIERGNYDIYALLLTLLTVWVLLNHPEKVWTQVILLSIATNLKIYPAILFILLLKKHGKKMILPTIVSNLVFLFILGPNNLIAFINTLLSRFGIGNTRSWIGNHSSYSFAETLLKNVYPDKIRFFIPLWIILTMIPLLLWGASLIPMFKKKFSPQTAILFYMVSVPVMDLVPTVSHDYKLIILYSTAALLIGYILRCIIRKSSIFDYFELILLCVIFLAISRSYVFFKEDGFWILANKYIWSLSFEALIVWNVFKLKKTDPDLLDVK